MKKKTYRINATILKKYEEADIEATSKQEAIDQYIDKVFNSELCEETFPNTLDFLSNLHPHIINVSKKEEE